MATELAHFPKGNAANHLFSSKAAAKRMGVRPEVLTAALQRGNVPGYYAYGRSGEIVWFIEREIVQAFVKSEQHVAVG